MITVVIPVGPREADKEYLPQAIESVREQTERAEILIVDDMANLPLGRSGLGMRADLYRPTLYYPREGLLAGCVVHRNAWRLGCAASWNVGIALASNELCFMMAADDWLEPTCLEHCVRAYTRIQDAMGYYYVSVRYHVPPGVDAGVRDQGVQTLPCNAAMIHRALWRYTGGFPPEVAVGAPDAAFISILLGKRGKAGNLYPVAEGKPLYNYRVHPAQETGARGSWQGVILATRDLVTAQWQPVEWGRWEP